MELDRDSIEHIINKGLPSSKEDTPSTHTEALDLELGPLPPAVVSPGHAQKPPEYQANATSGRTPGGFWLPDRLGHRPEQRTNTNDGGIVKTIQLDQTYES